MKIIIETIDHKDQRYNTVGDWQWGWIDGETNEFVVPSPLTRNPSLSCDLRILVSNLKDEKMNSCIIIHELIEALLCKFFSPEITTEQVDAFDMSHPKLDEPGDSFEAPYHIQHMIAQDFEDLLASKLDINREEYQNRIDRL